MHVVKFPAGRELLLTYPPAQRSLFPDSSLTLGIINF